MYKNLLGYDLEPNDIVRGLNKPSSSFTSVSSSDPQLVEVVCLIIIILFETFSSVNFLMNSPRSELKIKLSDSAIIPNAIKFSTILIASTQWNKLRVPCYCNFIRAEIVSIWGSFSFSSILESSWILFFKKLRMNKNIMLLTMTPK